MLVALIRDLLVGQKHHAASCRIANDGVLSIAVLVLRPMSAQVLTRVRAAELPEAAIVGVVVVRVTGGDERSLCDVVHGHED